MGKLPVPALTMRERRVKLCQSRDADAFRLHDAASPTIVRIRAIESDQACARVPSPALAH